MLNQEGVLVHLERPEEIDSRTLMVRTGCGNAFVIYSVDSAYPYEVIAVLGKHGTCARANLEAMSRIVTCALKYGCPEEELTKNLMGITCPASNPFACSCPEAFAKTLKRKMEDVKDGA